MVSFALPTVSVGYPIAPIALLTLTVGRHTVTVVPATLTVSERIGSVSQPTVGAAPVILPDSRFLG